MNADAFTTAARAEAEERWPHGPNRSQPLSHRERMDRRAGFDLGAQWARDRLAAHSDLTVESDEPTDAARIIDQHRIGKRWIGDGVRIECHCGHESAAVWDPAAGPITDENNTHRVADRLHAAHVASALTAAKGARA